MWPYQEKKPMSPTRRILAYVPPDAEEGNTALGQALFLGTGTTDSTVTLVTVLEPLPASLSHYSSKERDLSTERNVETRRNLETLAAAATSSDTAIETKVLVGRTATSIVQEALRGKYDVVLKAAENQDSLLGATATRLMRACPCPVYIVHPKMKQPPKRVLIAIDASAKQPREIALQRKILNTTQLLTPKEAELHALHVMPNSSDHFLQGRMKSSEYHSYLDDRLSAARESLEHLIADSTLILSPERIHVRRGRPSDAILDFARQRSIDLVALGTLARTGVSGFLIGNTAERILRRVESSVLGIKPSDFVSPIPPA